MSNKEFLDEDILFSDEDDKITETEESKVLLSKEISKKPTIQEESIYDKKNIDNKKQSNSILINKENKSIKIENNLNKEQNSEKKELKREKEINNVTKQEINNKDKKRNNSNKQTSITKIFTISKKNAEALKIIEELSGQSFSNYICQAVIEKYHREHEKKEDMKISLKDQVKEVLNELVGEKYIILKSSNDNVFVNTDKQTENIIEDKIELSTETEIEKRNLLLKMASEMDDDDD